MMMAYAKTGRLELSLESMRALMGYATIFRMDSPLVSWGSAVYQPNDPINTVYDMFGVPSALLRMLWDPVYYATSLTLSPHVPGNFSSLAQLFPLRWGGVRLYVSCSGNPASAISGVAVNGSPISSFTATSVELQWASMPSGNADVSVEIKFGGAAPNAEPLAPLNIVDHPHPETSAAAVRALRALAPQDAAVWLDATASFNGVADGTPIAQWPDISPLHGAGAAQLAPALQPLFRTAALSGRPAVQFDGKSTFLQGALNLGAASTIVAVLHDLGSDNPCCTGVFFSLGGCNGLSTRANPLNDDADAVTTMIDWSGSADAGQHDIANRQVIVTILYNSTGSYSFADGCVDSVEGPAGAAGNGFMVGSRNAELGRYFNGTLGELMVFNRSLSDAERESVEAYLLQKWPPSSGRLKCLKPLNCTLSPPLVAAQAKLVAFAAAMRGAGFSDERYELAHAQLALDAVAAWQVRCAGLTDGSISPLANMASELAADAMYRSTPQNLHDGLASVIAGYSRSADPVKRQIYTLWEAS
jgi:hypothetical protein